MGFLISTPTVTMTAKLTPFGRQQLLLNSNSIITKFSIGDSDANYYGTQRLANGRVPDIAGELGVNNTVSNGVYSGVSIKNPIYVNTTGATKKAIQAGSNTVVITPFQLGVSTTSGATLTKLIINRTLGDTDGNTNLFKTFGLPITQANKDLYNLSSPTGYVDTAIRDLNQDKALVIGIDSCLYGEVIDGKTVKIVLTTTGGTTYDIYSTFQKSTTALTTVDNQVVENLNLGTAVGSNIAFLFSDTVQKPNNDSTKSWATGYGLTKPFSVNNKALFNPISVTSTATVRDTAIGVVYLDRGIIVITNQAIVNSFDIANLSAVTVTYDSISNEVAQNITCIVERTEFGTTSNLTHGVEDMIRVTEVALYDNSNNVIAFAKSNEPIIIGANQYMAIGVRILV